jgi:hypothetical protein
MGLGQWETPCYGRLDASNRKRDDMAEEEPLLVSPPTQDVAVHVADYTRFTKLWKYSAIICLIIAFIVLLILK